MAGADYWSCDVCGSKTFYDAELDYGNDPYHICREDGAMLPFGAGDMAAICPSCTKTHEVVVREKAIGKEVQG